MQNGMSSTPGRDVTPVERVEENGHVRERAVKRAAQELAAGGVIAIPTDTVYGLAASLDRPDALERVYEIKGRPGDRPLPVLLASADRLDQIAFLRSAPMRAILSRFWPGALTVALPARPGLPSRVLAADGTVGVRVPAHPVAIALLREAGGALAVTSANRSGESPGLDASEVLASLTPDIDLVLDAGSTPGDRASTVIGVDDDKLVLHREGAIAWSVLQQAWQLAGGKVVAPSSGRVR